MSWAWWGGAPEASADGIGGAASIVEADDTATATGAVAISGALAATEASDAVAAASVLLIGGTLSAAEVSDAVVSAGTLPLAGAVGMTEAGDAVSAVGTIVLVAAASISEADDAVNATARVPVKALLSIMESDDAVLSSFWPVLQVHPRGGPWPLHSDEIAWSRRDWERDLRRIIDEAWRIANGEIDPVTREEIPEPDLTAVQNTLALLAEIQAQERMRTILASRERRDEDEAIALLLLAA